MEAVRECFNKAFSTCRRDFLQFICLSRSLAQRLLAEDMLSRKEQFLGPRVVQMIGEGEKYGVNLGMSEESIVALATIDRRKFFSQRKKFFL